MADHTLRLPALYHKNSYIRQFDNALINLQQWQREQQKTKRLEYSGNRKELNESDKNITTPVIGVCRK